MEIVGEWPALIFGSFCGAIIIRALNKSKMTKAYISSAFIVLVIFGLMFYGSISTAKHISGKISAAAIPICIAVSAILTAITIFAVMKISEEKAEDFLVPAIKWEIFPFSHRGINRVSSREAILSRQVTRQTQ